MRRWLPILVLAAACGGSGDDDATGSCEEDCAAAGLVCGDIGNGPECVTECEQMGVDETPTCAPGGVRSCEDDHVVVTPCEGDTYCEAGACVDDDCAGVGPMGRCTGDTLATCDGALVETDCAATGEVCAYQDDDTGYACRAPGEVGANVVSGTVRYEDRPPLESGFLGAITEKLARGVRVSIVLDSAPTTALATALTADDGSYRLHYDATAGAQVHVLAAAQNPSPMRPIVVVNRQGNVHGQGAASFAAAASATSDVLATDASGVSEAMNALDQATLTMDMIRRDFGVAAPEPLRIVWQRGTGDYTSYYDGDKIDLLGEDEDDDGYDDTVILHETGHYVEYTQGRDDNPGGDHAGEPVDPNLAWSEGFCTYLSLALRADPVYFDTNVGGGWSWEYETSLTEANPNAPIGQRVSEDMVTEILWDLGDAETADDDDVASGHGDVLRVESTYIRAGAFRSVGEAGTDLVDFLDGWFLAVGLAPCAAAEAVITGERSFPYDYAGPAGSCF